jgi:hypothetical protein
MSHPRVSVCLPNLNNARFLPERLETVFGQTFANWEMIVIDSYSDDGAWELLQQAAQNDARIAVAQTPRDGIYPNWNRCIERARGEFIYIATSDDTMPPDCLEKLVAALDASPDCDIAHCPLHIVDEHSTEVSPNWYPRSVFALTSGELLWRPHVRKAPFDGLLHLLGQSVYISITQLLIRRSLFDRIGLFPCNWGSTGDFHWNMRAALVANTVHVPDTWGGWRVHSQQATAGAGIGSEQHATHIDAMIEDALRGFTLSPINADVVRSWMDYAQQSRSFDRSVEKRERGIARIGFAATEMIKGSPAATRFVARRFGSIADWRTALVKDIQKNMDGAGLGPALIAA